MNKFGFNHVTVFCIHHYKIILKFDKEILKKIMLDCRTSQ